MYTRLKCDRTRYVQSAMRKYANGTQQSPQIWENTQNWWNTFTDPNANGNAAWDKFGKIYQDNPFLATATTAVVPWLAGTVIDSVSGNNKEGGGGIGVGGVLGLAGLGLGLYHAWPTLKEYYNGYQDSSRLQKLMGSKTPLTPEQHNEAVALSTRLGKYDRFRDSFLVNKQQGHMLDMMKAQPQLMADLHGLQFNEDPEDAFQFVANLFDGNPAQARTYHHMLTQLHQAGKLSDKQMEKFDAAYQIYSKPRIVDAAGYPRANKNSIYQQPNANMDAYSRRYNLAPLPKQPQQQPTAEQPQQQQPAVKPPVTEQPPKKENSEQ